MNKKGYFFLMDAIFAVVILTIGYLMISSNTPRVTSEVPLTMYLDNTMELISTVKGKVYYIPEKGVPSSSQFEYDLK